MISLADKPLHDMEVDGRLVFHERRLPSIAVLFKSDARLSCFDDAVRAP